MNTTKIDLTSLNMAIGQLNTALDYSLSPMAKADPKLFEQFRNSVIQCFEYSYELSVKFLRRYIESVSDSPSEIDEWDFKTLIREGAVRGLIANPEDWFEFRRLRNTSPHAYSMAKAVEVYERASYFLAAATTLAKLLEKKVPDL